MKSQATGSVKAPGIGARRVLDVNGKVDQTISAAVSDMQLSS
jgi:hypothetical protein